MLGFGTTSREPSMAEPLTPRRTTIDQFLAFADMRVRTTSAGS